MTIRLTCLWAILLLSASLCAQTTVQGRCVAEVTLKTQHTYANPFTDVDVDAIVTDPKGSTFRVPAFWDGGGVWKFRYSSGLVGKHEFMTVCTDSANPELNGIKGAIEVTPYKGEDPLYLHGPAKVADDQRHFAYADGKPFFWLADTWWKALTKRISLDGFKQLTADREKKGFTVVQIIAGPYPDEPDFDPRWANEAGFPYEPEYRQINPAYFDLADRKMEALIDHGIEPAIVGGWGWHMDTWGVEKFTRHWRYLIARYGAYPVFWIIAGEAAGDQWTQVARAVRKMDPFHRPMTLHPQSQSSGRRSMTDDQVLDFDMLQTNHDNWNAAAVTVAGLTESVSKVPAMPALVGEVTYEGHMMGNREDLQRFMFWICMLNGAAGHTYGAGGLMEMNSETERGGEFEFTTWSQAMVLPGSAEVGAGKKLLEQYPWWRFVPHPDWIEPPSTALLDPHSVWRNTDQLWAQRGGRWDLCYSAGVPGECRFVFIPGGHIYNWHAPTVMKLEPDVSYRACYYDTCLGRRFDLGVLVNPIEDGPAVKDDFSSGQGLSWKDYGSRTQRGSGVLTGGKNLMTCVDGQDIQNVKVSAGAGGDAEAGLILRFHDQDNYVVGLYSPTIHAIFIHDRRHGQWGPLLGRTDVPPLGPHIRMTGVVAGNVATFYVTDGKLSYSTASAPLEKKDAGLVGLWHYQVGDSQQFDDFEMTKIHIDPVPAKPNGELLVLHEFPGVLGPFPVASTTILLGNRYQPPRMPSPQDWLLILEKAR